MYTPPVAPLEGGVNECPLEGTLGVSTACCFLASQATPPEAPLEGGVKNMSLEAQC